MKFMETHWTVGKFSRRHRSKDCLLVDWDAVRSEAMSQEERLYDETKVGHADLTTRYRRALEDAFSSASKPWPEILRFKGKLRMFAIRQKFPMLPGLDKCILGEQVYDLYPDLEQVVETVNQAPDI